MKYSQSLQRMGSCALLSILFVAGCNTEQEAKSPQLADVNSVGCLVANDFYAVHFSAYVQPTAGQSADREALLRPYCQEIPTIGKTFFSADLIDRDVRKTPIGIRVVEMDGVGTPLQPAKELRTLTTVPAQLYPQGVVSAQAQIDKLGDYALILSIGGEEAISEEDQLHVPFHVGKKWFDLSQQTLIVLGVGLVVTLTAVGYALYRRRKQRRLAKS